MAAELTIPTIIQIGQISQVLANIGNQKATLVKSQTLDQRLPRTIYEVWKPLSLRYAANPSDITIRGVAEYLLSLCGPYALQARQILNNLTQTRPVVTGPSNQSGNVGFTAVFTIAVTSSLSFTIQWYRNGVLIPGATGITYMIANAQLTDSGSTFSAVVTNAAGSSSSATATLTVTAALSGSYYFGDTDYFAALQGGTDNVPYVGTFSITNGQPLSVTLPSGAANNKYEVYRYPVSQGIKTIWYNTPSNNGQIPDQAFESVLQIGSFYYIVSRGQISIDTTSPMVFS